MHVSCTRESGGPKGNGNCTSTVVAHDDCDVVIVSQSVSGIVGAEHRQVSKGDDVSIARVNEGHHRGGVLGHVEIGAGQAFWSVTVSLPTRGINVPWQSGANVV